MAVQRKIHLIIDVIADRMSEYIHLVNFCGDRVIV